MLPALICQFSIIWHHVLDNVGRVRCDDLQVMNPTPMVRINRSSLADEIRKSLRELILSGAFQPGQRLTEQQVARDMGTSQGPVREAFATLCQEGLLISLPHRGTFVSSVSESEARMVYALRELIEPHVAQMAASRITEQDLEHLRSDLEDMKSAALAGDVQRHIAADVRFHGRLYELAGSAVLNSTWETLAATIRQFVALVAPLYVTNLSDAAGSHVVLIDLLRRGDADSLKAEVTEHVQNIWKRIGAEDQRGTDNRSSPK